MAGGNSTKPVDPLNPTFDESQGIVSGLAEDFAANAKHYLSGDYLEAQARKDFIDKFLIALGWDVNHEVQKNPYQQEVKVERAVQTATAQRHADYGLALAPNFEVPVLYIEAKKPGAGIATPDNCFQTIRYANQVGHPIGILTSFEEFLVIDCRYQANIDTAAQCVLQKHHFGEYPDPEKFAKVYYLVSRPEIAKGAIDTYAETLPKPKKRGGQQTFGFVPYKPIDELLLATLDDLRESLARNLKLRNPQLDSGALTEITQRILDRLVLIRFLEDKLIEPVPIIPKLGRAGATAWQDFITQSRVLDNTYNGIVFKKNEPLDSPGSLKIDDRVFADILDQFDYHKSKYLFNHIPIHILGSIYERFLGNVIVATPKRATLAPKPEVRKAGGVYYTPKYIVDYIVANTVGKLIDGKTPAQISKMRFADIACGSGSFLLGVYDCLLKYVAHWYGKHPSRVPKGAVVKQNGGMALSLEEKGRILTDNIYGVDIDTQAVEVTQLSLYLKLLEEETTASARQYTLAFHRPLLPSLANNIKCGNSLIAPDFYSNRQLAFLDLDHAQRVNAFDWKAEFPQVMASGGFDIIVGNPPYIRVGNIDESLRPYIYTHYAVDHRFDIYVAFVQKAFELLGTNGLMGYIVPNKFFTAEYAQGLREYISSRHAAMTIVDFEDTQVFKSATTYTCLLFLARQPQTQLVYQAASATPLGMNLRETFLELDVTSLSAEPWRFASQGVDAIVKRLKDLPSLGTVAEILRGLETGFDDFFLLTLDTETTEKNVFVSKVHPNPFQLEPEIVQKVTKGAVDVRRYFIEPTSRYLFFPYRHTGGVPTMIPEHEMREHYPLAWAYLMEHASELRKRKGARWYEFRRRNYDLTSGSARILVPSIGRRAAFTLDAAGEYQFIGSGGGGGGGYALRLRDTANFSIEYLLAVLNSRLIDFLIKLVNSKFHSSYYSFNRQYIEPLPIRSIDPKSKSDKRQHDEIVTQVKAILSLYEQVGSANREHARTVIQRQIDATDAEIDRLVYELYGLTDEEISIVKAGSTASL